MAAPVIQFKRGLLANLPGLRAGEPGFTTDSYDLYVGIDSTTNNNQFVGSGRYWSVNTATVGSGVKLVEGTNNGTNSVTLKSPNSLATSYTLTMPADDGNANDVLVSDGSGNLSFSAPAASSFTLSADSGSNDTFSTGGTLTFTGGDGVATAVSDDTITISASDVTTSQIAASTLVIESEGIGSNDNDTTIPTSAAVKDYVDGQLGGGGGSAGTVATQSTSTDATHFLTFVDANNGSATQEAIKTDAGVTYNPSSNLFTISNLSMAGVAVTAILDEDTLGSNRADALATQQSIKAYVDSQVTAQDLDLAGDSGTGAVDLDSQSLTIAGTANEVETSASGQTVTIGLPAAVQVTTSIDVPTVEATNLKAKDGTTAITITDSTGAVAMAQNLTVAGNLIVNGSTTQVNTSQTTIEDQLLELGMVDGSAPSSDLNKDIGVVFNYYTSSAKKAAVYWDDSVSRIVVAAEVSESSGVLTNDSAGALEIGSLYLNDCAGNTQVISCSGSTRSLENISIDGGSF